MGRAKEISDAIEVIFEACDSIKEDGRCDKCPMKHTCLEDTSFIEFADLLYEEKVKEILKVADL